MMQRRTFVESLLVASFLTPLMLRCKTPAPQNLEGLLKIFLKQTDVSIDRILARQQLEEGHPNYGGFPDQFEIYHHGTPPAYARNLVTGYISEDSKYYKSKEVAKALSLSMDFLLSVQNEDGSIDLLTTNFNSPPDAAFAVEPLSIALELQKLYASSELSEFVSKATLFLKRAGASLVIGGIHTPNHRWVVCRALTRLNNLFPNPSYLSRIDQWLGEGIDIDPDGQYTEKSMHYSPLVDDCFITIARLLGKPELYEPVRKNLNMIPYMLHANGELVTEVSTRQDQYKKEDLRRYYYAFRYMALHDQDEQFAAMANYIEQQVEPKNLSANLGHFLLDPTLHKDINSANALPSDYVKHFSHSKLLRIRRADVDASIVGDNYAFFSFFKGACALQAVRFATAFFGKGQFISEDLEVGDNKYILRQELEGPYYQPHLEENIAADGNWHDMPRIDRPQSEVQHLTSTITITENKGTFELHFNIEGTARVPVSIELNFREGGIFTGVKNLDDGIHLLDGKGTYTIGKETIYFGESQPAHEWTQLRGALPKLKGDSVYLTGYTPFDYKLEIS